MIFGQKTEKIFITLTRTVVVSQWFAYVSFDYANIGINRLMLMNTEHNISTDIEPPPPRKERSLLKQK